MINFNSDPKSYIAPGIAAVIGIGAALLAGNAVLDEFEKHTVDSIGECTVDIDRNAEDIAKLATPDGKDYRIVLDQITPQGEGKLGELVTGQEVTFNLPENSDPAMCDTYTAK